MFLNLAKLLIIFCTVSYSTVLKSAEIILQSGDQGTSSIGNWYYASAASMDFQGNNGMYTSISSAEASYTFAPTFPESTSYDVQVYNTCYTPRSHQVRYIVNHSGGSEIIVADQDCNTDPYVGSWRSLGEYMFSAGNAASVVIDSAGSNNSYVGASAVKFVYTPSNNAMPNITVIESIDVNEGETITIAATAYDIEDGDLTSTISWTSPSASSIGGQFDLVAGNDSFLVQLSVTDSNNASAQAAVVVNVTPISQPPIASQVYDFECDTLEPIAGLTTNNASALPAVGKKCGRYTAELTNNTNDITLHWNNQQGRFDGVLVSFPFTAIVRNVGVSPIGAPDSVHTVGSGAYNFSGIQVHHENFQSLNSAHVVVGQRGLVENTIEGKMTRNGVSSQSDLGHNLLSNGRADIRIIGHSDRSITVDWQQAQDNQSDAWIPYNGTGILPGLLPVWGDNIYVGLITYAYGQQGVPFSGVAESLSIVSGVPN